MNDYDESKDDEWTAKFRAQCGSLAETRVPSGEMKQRTLAAARAARHVRARPRATLTRFIALLAAAALIFVAGTFLGFALATRATTPTNTAGAANHEAVAVAQSFTMNSEPKRHIIWY